MPIVALVIRSCAGLLAEELYFDFVIRFRGNITVTAASGETRTAADWVQAGGRARLLRGAEVTADRSEWEPWSAFRIRHEASLVPRCQQH